MLEQQQTEEAPHTAFAVADVLQTAPPAPAASAFLSPPAQILIARYLAQTGTEQISDTRARLEALTLAYSELDALPQRAVDAAIRHLESEQQTAALAAQQSRQQAFGQRRRSRRAKQSARPATLTALKLFGPGALALVALFSACFMVSYTSPLFHLVGQLTIFSIFGLPALLGVAVGARVKHRPALGTFYAMGLVILLASLVAAVVSPLLAWREFLWLLPPLLTLFWVPIGTASAGLTGWARKARNKRRHAAALRTAQQARALRVKV